MSKATCTGRTPRFFKNRSQLKKFNDSPDDITRNLDSSLTTNVDVSKAGDKSKLFFTVWSVAYTTATITTTYTDNAVTVIISALCIPAGYPVPPLC